MQKVLVTGGGGFIGSHLVRALLERGDEVRVVESWLTGRRSNLAELADDDFELRAVDLRDAAAIREACRGVEVIYHQAALPSVPRSVAAPRKSAEINIGGTLNVLEAAREEGVGHVVFASSSSVYGDTEVLPKHEGMMPNPRSPYAAQKLACEQLGQTWSRCYELSFVALRYFNVYGPRQDPSSDYAAVVPSFICAQLDGQAPLIHGDGEQSRDFTFVGDVVAANLAAARYTGALVANIAEGRQTTIRSLLERIAGEAGGPPAPRFGEPRAGDVRHSRASITRAQSELGWRPATSLEEGLKTTAAWYRAQGERHD
jgi:nucleoside-diphosphate-sugar epimerase